MSQQLPGYQRLECAETVEGTAAQLVQLALDAIKSSGKKKVKIEVEIEAKLAEDGKTIKLEVETEAKEDGREEKRELEYEVPA